MILALCITALIFSVLSFIVSCVLYIELKAMQKSTHNVQLVPAEKVKTDEKGFEVLTNKVRGDLEDETDLFN